MEAKVGSENWRWSTRDLWVKRVWRVAVEMKIGGGVAMVDWGKNGIGLCRRRNGHLLTQMATIYKKTHQKFEENSASVGKFEKFYKWQRCNQSIIFG